MFLDEGNIINVIDEPLNADEVICEKNRLSLIEEDPFYVCSISDVIEKYRVWQRSMPRVVPFYGQLKVRCPRLLSD